MMSLRELEVENVYISRVAILNIQDGGHKDISANVNITFRNLHPITFPKMYRFRNPPNYYERKYIHARPVRV